MLLSVPDGQGNERSSNPLSPLFLLPRFGRQGAEMNCSHLDFSTFVTIKIELFSGVRLVLSEKLVLSVLKPFVFL